MMIHEIILTIERYEYSTLSSIDCNVLYYRYKVIESVDKKNLKKERIKKKKKWNKKNSSK